MPLVISPRRKTKCKISEAEFIVTKLLLDNLYVDYEPGYELSFNLIPVSYNDTLLHFSERYVSLSNIPNDLTIFRPLKNDKHANILIDMFEQLNIMDIDNVTIIEYSDKGNKAYKGYFTNNCKKIDKSYTYNAPTIPVLKVFMIGKLILNSEDYDTFISNLMQFNHQIYKNRAFKSAMQALNEVGVNNV